MIITKAKKKDLSRIMEIVEKGRERIKQYGIDQWQHGHPNIETFSKDVELDRLFVIVDKEIEGVFAIMNHDISYDQIDGEWLDNSDYVAIHRVCVDKPGLGTYLFNELKKKYKHIRVDTHKGNIAMNKCLLKNGFTYCGVITLRDDYGNPKPVDVDGGLRNAYEYVEKKDIN